MSIQPSSGRDRRRHDRANIQMEAVLQGETPGDLIHLEVLNFSVGGFFCRITKPMELMTKLGICFEFPAYSDVNAKEIEAVAVIVRCEEPTDDDDRWSVGACFIDLDQEARDHIEEYVAWHQDRDIEMIESQEMA